MEGELMSRTKAKTKPTLPAEQAAALVRTIDEALEILARGGATENLHPSKIAPLPSLLERCEAALSRSRSEQSPLRFLHCLPCVDEEICTPLFARLPNVRLISSPLLRGVETKDPATLAIYARAEAAAYLDLVAEHEAYGLSTVLKVDHGPRYMGKAGKRGASRQNLTPFVDSDRDVRALVLVRHPFASYLEAQRCGLLGSGPISLEDYSKRYHVFLDDCGDWSWMTVEDAVNEPGLALTRIAAALDLAVPDELLANVAGEQASLPFISLSRPSVSASSIIGPRGADEPLDTPMYRRLCERLSYDPDEAPKGKEMPAAGIVLDRPLPASRSGSRLAAFLPLLARVTDGDIVPVEEAGRGQYTLDASGFVALAEDCLSDAGGFYERLDTHLRHLPVRDGALLLICCAAHYTAKNEAVHALGLLAEAEEMIDGNDRPLRLLSAELLLRLRKPDLALATLTADALAGPLRLEPVQQSALREALGRYAPSGENEHGHALLLSRLRNEPPAPTQRRRVMIEIGTTREHVPGQGSTEKLARLCAELNIDFVTVDMDQRNSAMARRMFRRLGLPFRAVTAKGEDFLSEWAEGLIDYCFLDAYDFDHGQHSELRQSRYEAFLGSRISDAQCHRMHLDCAHSLVEKLSPDGIICFDDTWMDEEGVWTAKGKTAMPYLLSRGFRVVDARNRAALLVRESVS